VAIVHKKPFRLTYLLLQGSPLILIQYHTCIEVQSYLYSIKYCLYNSTIIVIDLFSELIQNLHFVFEGLWPQLKCFLNHPKSWWLHFKLWVKFNLSYLSLDRDLMNPNEEIGNQMHIHLTVYLAHLLFVMYKLWYPFTIATKKLKQRRGFHVQPKLKKLTFFIDLLRRRSFYKFIIF
jgi:hypothetical protein